METETQQLKFIDLCAGIGGGRLGMERAGFKCIAFSEINEAAIRTYRLFHNTKGEVKLGDLTKIYPPDVPDHDALIAGFPCQTFSSVGKRAGFGDHRGLIIFYIRDILVAKKTKGFILENVKGLTNHDGGHTFRRVLEVLDEAGYHVHHKILISSDFGLPQIRERIYLVGIRKDLPGANTFEFPKPTGNGDLKDFLIDTALWAESVPLAPLLRCLEAQEAGERKKVGFSLSKILAEDYLVIDPSQFNSIRFFRGVVPTLIRVRGGEMCYVRNGHIRRITGRERLLLQGFTMEHFEKARAISNNDLINQTGNAMSVNVIEAIAKKLHAKLATPLP